MTTAYSFIRFSSPEQAKGDSLRRQLEASERFAAEHSLILDSSFRDLGKSASKGEHVGPTSALGRFIGLVECGQIEAGCWLIVEDMDRLDRRQVNVALKQFLLLLEAGIIIHTMIDSQTYTLQRINGDPTALILSILKMIAAHDYTDKLGKRISAKWQSRREAMRNGNGKATNACVGWLKAVDGEFHVIPGRLAVINRIIADRHLGVGRHAIATRLNLDGVPTFRGGDGWHPSTIAALVKNKALIGIYQPRNAGGTPDGDPIEGFYPRIISDEDFWRAQWGPDNKGPRGRKTKGLANLLSEVCHCARCGAGLVFVNTGKERFLVCGRARRGLCDNRYHRTYPSLERELLFALGLFDFTRVLDRTNPQADRIAAIGAEVAETTAIVDRLLEDFRANTPVSVSRRIAALEGRKDALMAEFDELRRTTRIAEAQESRDAYTAFKALIDGLATMEDAEARYRVRTRISSELRRIIETALSNGPLLTIRLHGDGVHWLELRFHRSTLESLRLRSSQNATTFVFDRDVLIAHADGGDFAGYVADAMSARRGA